MPEPDWSYCLSEELIQAFGLLNDTDDVPYTVFNDNRDSREFTRFDLHLLRMLADSRIRPGMSITDVMSVLVDGFPSPDPDIPFTQEPLDFCSYNGGKPTCSRP